MTLKQKIIEQVNSIEDETILNEIYSLITVEKDFERVYKFSSEQLQELQEGIEDADSDRYYSEKKSEKLIAEWLQEKSDGL